jgi:hypothetical protein
MVFFFLIPSIPAVLGNFLVPMMIGAKDVAFPKLNLLSWYLFVGGVLMALIALMRGSVATGWTFYAPLSSTYTDSTVVWVITGAFLAGFSSILTGLNFIVTIHKMRAPGLTWFRLPLFIWSHYATSLIQVLGTPVVAITLLLLMVENIFHVGVFDPALGGDPVLFQHLVLVLLASGGLHHGAARLRRYQRSYHLLFAQADLRLQVHRVFQHRHRDLRLFGVGPSPVRFQPVGLREPGVLGHQLFGGDSLGH